VSAEVLPAALCLRFGLLLGTGDEMTAFLVVPGRNLVAPPQLARDAPVLDIAEPLVVGGGPVLGHELDLAAGHFVERHFGDRLARVEGAFRRRLGHGDEPLVGQHRFDDHVGAVAARHHQLVRLDRFQQAQRVEVGDDLLARHETVHADVGGGGVVGDLRVQRQDGQQRQLVALADRVVVEVVRRRDLHAAGAEFLVDVLVGDDRDGAVAQRQFQHPADQVGVALVARIDGDGDVAQQRLGTRGGDRQAAQAVDRAVGEFIDDMPHRAVFLLRDDFEVRHRGAQHRVPVHQALAAVDQALFEQAHEHLGDDLRTRRVHREVFARPVRRGAEAAHLAEDRGARFLLPLPDLLDEFFAAEVVARNLLRVELAFDHDLRGDAGVVGARNPGGVMAEHAVVARQAVHDGLVERVAHVQRAGDVRRRQLDRERRLAGIHAGCEITALFPLGAPVFLDFGGFERLG
jgi:hypothetical protein